MCSVGEWLKLANNQSVVSYHVKVRVMIRVT